MDTWDVEFLKSADGAFGLFKVSVQAENRARAITKASRRARRHRDMCVSAKRRNPASGGGTLPG